MRASLTEKLATSAATAMSQAQTRPTPPPSAAPCTRAIVGLGTWAMREVWYRPDVYPDGPATALPVRATRPEDGWCDAPGDPNYNRPVTLPYPASTERMWRDDHVYDLVVILGHNDDPPVPGMGSAIFMHLARDGYPGTEGCVALGRPDIEAVLAVARPGDMVEIVAD